MYVLVFSETAIMKFSIFIEGIQIQLKVNRYLYSLRANLFPRSFKAH